MRSPIVALLVLTGLITLPALTAPGGVAMRAPEIGDETGDVDDELEDAHTYVSNLPDLADGGALAIALGRAEDGIELILSDTPPSLSEPGAGVVDTSIQPVTLSEYAEICADLAAEAHMLVLLDDTSHVETIGTNLRTIQALLPGYRAAAGLD